MTLAFLLDRRESLNFFRENAAVSKSVDYWPVLRVAEFERRNTIWPRFASLPADQSQNHQLKRSYFKTAQLRL